MTNTKLNHKRRRKWEKRGKWGRTEACHVNATLTSWRHSPMSLFGFIVLFWHLDLWLRIFFCRYCEKWIWQYLAQMAFQVTQQRHFKIPFWGLGDNGSVGEVFLREHLSLITRTHIKPKSWAWYCMRIIPILRRKQRWVDPCHSLASQYELLDQFQDSERSCLKRKIVNVA